MRSASSSTRTTAAARAANSRKTRRRCCFSAGRSWSARWASRAASRGCRRRSPTRISQAGPWGAGYRRPFRRKASPWRAGRRSKYGWKKRPSAFATHRPARRTGAGTASLRNDSNSGRAARTASTTACVTAGRGTPGKSNGWRPEGLPAGSREGGGLEAAARPGRNLDFDRSARGYELLLLEFRGRVAGRERAQAAVQRFAGHAVVRRLHLEFGGGVAGRQIAQSAVLLFAGDPIALLEFGRLIARRQIAQAAVQRFAQDLEGIVHCVGRRVGAEHSRREQHRDHRSQCQNFTGAHRRLLLLSVVPRGCGGADKIALDCRSNPTSAIRSPCIPVTARPMPGKSVTFYRCLRPLSRGSHLIRWAE